MRMPITATLPANDKSNAKNFAGDKETLARKVVVAYHKGEIKELVDARWYAGRSRNASTVYASVWCHNAERYFSGHGSASGYGYHKGSAALDAAFASAGVKLSEHIDGVGDSAENDALIAVAKRLAPRAKAFRIV